VQFSTDSAAADGEDGDEGGDEQNVSAITLYGWNFSQL